MLLMGTGGIINLKKADPEQAIHPKIIQLFGG
jgi:hypothetical protein